jgi:hypothetical protein
MCFSDLAEMDCEWIFDCIEACSEGDQACYEYCVNSASLLAQAVYNNLVQCLSDSGYFDCAPDDEKCLSDAESECLDELDACFPPGTKSCEEMFDCMDTCEKTDQACYSNCYQSGTKEAQATFGASVDCIIAECGESATPECEDAALAGTCAEMYQECLGE